MFLMQTWTSYRTLKDIKLRANILYKTEAWTLGIERLEGHAWLFLDYILANAKIDYFLNFKH